MAFHLILQCANFEEPLTWVSLEEQSERTKLAELGLRAKPLARHRNLDDLHLPAWLNDQMQTWNAAYQSTYDPVAPQNSGFASNHLRDDHIRQGALIAENLTAELPDDCTVEYKP